MGTAAGALRDAAGHCAQRGRFPDGSRRAPFTLAEQALLCVKQGHLPPGVLGQ
jgi:hypothetical protein